MSKSTAANIVLLVAYLVGVPLIGLMVSMHNFSMECAETGGTLSNEGFTSWCRY